MEVITLTINGKSIHCNPGESLLDAAVQNGFRIPTLCHHPDLKPFGACRVCLVEEQKSGRLLASCVTPAAQNMAILTDSPRVLTHRRNIVTLMLAAHPESCIVCDKGNRCGLRRAAADLGVGAIRLDPMPGDKTPDQLNPFIYRDLSKCILCGKCIRADHELVVTGAIDYSMRGIRSYPATLQDRPLERSGCTFCGTCVAVCPTGALTIRSGYVGVPEREVDTVCGFCGVGCRLRLGASNGRIVEANPAMDSKSVNGTTLCVRGHFGHDFLNSERRLVHPLIRRNGTLEAVSWDDALRETAQRLLALKERHGPRSIAFLGSSKCTNEENYLFQKIARSLLKTNNLDNGGYILGRRLLSSIENRTDGGGRFHFFAGSLAGLEKSDAILVMGADPTHSMPVMGYYLKRSAVNGTPIIVVDPRKTELAGYSALWLALQPGSDADLVHAVAAMMLARNNHDASFVERFVEGFRRYTESLGALDLSLICRRTGLAKESLAKAVDLLSHKKIAFVIGDGILKQRSGLETVDALLNLAMLTGSIAHKGAGFYIPAKENNMVGAWDMGSVPDALPGRRPVADKEARREWEAVWRTDLPAEPGLDLVAMIQAAEEGRLKGMFIMGENPLRSLPQPERVKAALSRLELIVTQDILLTETVADSHIVLPGAAFSEKEGAFVNMEGRLQQLSAAADPPGQARPDLAILISLARHLGDERPPASLAEVRAEIGQVLPLYARSSRSGQLVWIQRREGGEQAIPFSAVKTSVQEPVDPAYPFMAVIGSPRYHLGSGTRTALSPRIAAFKDREGIAVSEEDAVQWGVAEGDTIRLTSPAGSLHGRVRIDRQLRSGLVWLPQGEESNQARRLLGLTPLMDSASPGWNCCPVGIEKTEGGTP
ncbi:MAG: molybdopterin-dependent oxidoreductase [Thermodesulfobacteriota bacterium]